MARKWEVSGLVNKKNRAVRAFSNVKKYGREQRYRTCDQGRAMRRVRDLTRVYRHQYPDGLPHNGLGVKYARYMCRTLAFFASLEEREHWLDRHVPWMNAKIRASILGLSPYWYSPRSLGQHLELYDEEREDLKAWTIEAVDVSKNERITINKDKERRRGERRRREKGRDTREQYLSEHTKSREKPWKALRMGRTKFYQLGLHKPRTSPSAPSAKLNLGSHLSTRVHCLFALSQCLKAPPIERCRSPHARSLIGWRSS
jgi:hypothetical protein